MIEVGKEYKVELLVLTDEGYDTVTYYSLKCTGVDGYLAEFNGEKVINLASPLFHSAVDVQAENKNLEERVSRVHETVLRDS